MAREYQDTFYTISVGPKGEKGEKGEAGDTGEIGDRGDTGKRGEKGDKGEKGPPGDKGPRGIIGDRGDRGAIGPKGDKGDRGEKGDTGNAGEMGETGDRGEDGHIGKIGDVGPPGEDGDKGIKGDMGPVGDIGPRGLMGDVGDDGNPGDVGLKGDRGARGLKGETGPIGEAGDKGPTGEAGEIGPKGNKGLTGDEGRELFRRFSPGKVMIRKIIDYIVSKKLNIFIEITAPQISGVEGISGIESSTTILSRSLDSVFFTNGVVVPINNIECISILFDTIPKRREVLNELTSIFNDIKNRKNEAPNTIPINLDGEIIRFNDIVYDHEYIVDCSCINSTDKNAVKINEGGRLVNNSICIGRKIPQCDLESHEVNITRKVLDEARNDGKTISRIITYRRNFIDTTDILGSVLIGPTCLSIGTFLHDKTTKQYILSILNLEKISAIVFN